MKSQSNSKKTLCVRCGDIICPPLSATEEDYVLGDGRDVMELWKSDRPAAAAGFVIGHYCP